MDTTRGKQKSNPKSISSSTSKLRNFETWIKYFLNGHHLRKYETLPVEATIMTVIFPVSLIDRKVRHSSPNWYAGCIYASWDGRIICAIRRKKAELVPQINCTLLIQCKVITCTMFMLVPYHGLLLWYYTVRYPCLSRGWYTSLTAPWLKPQTRSFCAH